MIFANGWEGPPTPEQLAAYGDGELDGRDALSPLKGKVEAWLAKHPEARAELETQRNLRRLWETTTPLEPADHTWEAVWRRLPAAPAAKSAPAKNRFPIGWAAAVLAATAAGLVLAFWPPRQAVPPQFTQPAAPAVLLDDGEPFAVATAEEVEILRVEGRDTPSLAVTDPVGEPFVVASADEIEILRVEGADTHTLAVMDQALRTLELLGPGEMTLHSVQPAAKDNMMPQVRVEGPSRPMIWARLDSEMEDD